MTLPNPESDKSKQETTIEQNPSEQQRKSGAVKTSGFGDAQRAGTVVNTASDQNGPKGNTNWEGRQFWVQVVLTAFTGGAFLAAAVYACLANRNLIETHSLSKTAQGVIVQCCGSVGHDQAASLAGC